MIAGWRRRGVASARRSGRRTVVVLVALALLALVIAEVAADVVDAGQRAADLEAKTFVTEVIPTIDESNMLASTMHLVRHGATSLGRKGLQQALGRLVTGTSEDLAQLATMGIPAPTSPSGDLLQSTLAARAGAARFLTGGIALATGPTASKLGVAAVQARARAAALIVRAGKEMLLGDHDYRAFVSSLPRHSGRGRLPGSTWVSSPSSWSLRSATTWVAQLSGTPELQIHQDLVIVAVTVQPPVVRITGLPPTTTTSSTTTTSTSTTSTIPGATTSSTTSTSTSTTTSTTTTTFQLPPPGSTSILPPTRRVSVVLVIANAGNVRTSGIWAAASVLPAPGVGPHAKPGPPPHSVAVRIGRLAAGASVEVTLPPLAVASGRAYMLWVSVGTGALPAGTVTGPPKGPGETESVRIKVAEG